VGGISDFLVQSIALRMEHFLMQPKQDERRREMLAAIRDRLAASVRFDAVDVEPRAAPAIRIRGDGAEVFLQAPIDLVEQLCRAVQAVSGHCMVVRDEAEAAEIVRSVISQRQASRIAISDAPLVRRVVDSNSQFAEFLESPPQSVLFECEAGITSAQWAIAETGTLVLESGKESHRLASLVPPMHIALVEAGAIKQTMAEVLQALTENGREGLSPTVTFITGPSRTSDIELTLAIGVHGPAELHVIVIRPTNKPQMNSDKRGSEEMERTV
jgi:L-lactate dehydrogenase complex protein LldG